jgi:hypothetical protein
VEYHNDSYSPDQYASRNYYANPYLEPEQVPEDPENTLNDRINNDIIMGTFSTDESGGSSVDFTNRDQPMDLSIRPPYLRVASFAQENGSQQSQIDNLQDQINYLETFVIQTHYTNRVKDGIHVATVRELESIIASLANNPQY